MLQELRENPGFKACLNPSKHVEYVIGTLLRDVSKPVIGEVGVGVGASTIWIADHLSGRGEVHVFDWADRLDVVCSHLRSLGYSNIVEHANSRKSYDGYYWSLALIALENRRRAQPLLFDMVYLDGAHMFHQDAPSACILKSLIKPGGYLLFDDLEWTIAASPSVNPKVFPESAKWFTPAQLATPHIRMICELFFDDDPAWLQVELPKLDQSSRRLYQRKA